MPALVEQAGDRVMLAYEDELLKKIQGQASGPLEELMKTGPLAVKESIQRLSDEFCTLFCDGKKDPDWDQVRKSQDMIWLEDKRFSFPDLLSPNSTPESRKYYMAYAMLKIRQAVLYTENKNSRDGLNHVTFVQGDKARAFRRGEKILSHPIKPQLSGIGAQGWIARYEEKEQEFNRQQEKKAIRKEEKQRRTLIRFTELFQNDETLADTLKSHDPWWHRNSKDYKAFLSSLKEVNQFWKKTDNPENRQKLREAYQRLNEACNTYLDNHATPRSTDLGRRRVALVQKIRDMQQKEFRAMEGEILPEVSKRTIGSRLEETRSITLGVQRDSLQRVGAQTSERLRINYGGVNGFFTPDKTGATSIEELIRTEASYSRSMDQRTRDKFLHQIEGMKIIEDILDQETEEEFFDYFNKSGWVTDDNRGDWNRVAKKMAEAKTDCRQRGIDMSLDDVFTVAHKDKAQKGSLISGRMSEIEQCCVKYVFGINATASAMEKEDRCQEYILSLKDQQRKAVFTIEESKKIKDFLIGIRKKAASLFVANNAGISLERRGMLNERNIATSVMADLLGCPDIVARSEKASLTTLGYGTQKGMFMELAEGKSGGLESENETRTHDADHTKLLLNGKLKRQAADLQVMDCVCGQIDRHLNNMIFQTDPTGTDIVSLKGIDNDMAFGLISASHRGNHSAPLGLIRHVSKGMVEALDVLSPEVIDYRFQHLLSERERQALWNRIDVMREWVHSSNVTIVPEDQWDEMSWRDLAIGYFEEDGFCVNTFYKVRMVATNEEDSYLRSQVDAMCRQGKIFEDAVEQKRVAEKVQRQVKAAGEAKKQVSPAGAEPKQAASRK